MAIKSPRTQEALDIIMKDLVDRGAVSPRRVAQSLEVLEEVAFQLARCRLLDIAHDLDESCPCGTCNVVRHIKARYA